MPQFSSTFTAGKVSALSTGLLKRADMDRIAASASVPEALRLLADMGWGAAGDKPAFDALALRKVAEACALTRAITPAPFITDCFLLKYDIANLKILIKSKVLGKEASALSECGVYDRDILGDAVKRSDYTRLPEILRDALVGADSISALAPPRINAEDIVGADSISALAPPRINAEDIVEADSISALVTPPRIDAELDKALFAQIFTNLRIVRDAVVLRYFTASAELANLMIAFRCGAMGRSHKCAEGMFVPGGALDPMALGRVAGGSDSPKKLIGGKPYYPALRKGIDEYISGNGLALLEYEIDGYLLSVIRPHRHDIDNALPLIWYLLSREREVSSLRLIISAKAARLHAARFIDERMRALYAAS